MQINAVIKNISYTPYLTKTLDIIDLSDFDINTAPPVCLIKRAQNVNFAISKWVSPKRTRSYPFERVYNTLTNGKKITVIPVVKDEGADGDRDFIQWDTISLMSLLDVYVILAYYDKASHHTDKNKNKITKQKFNNAYVLSKIDQISNYLSSPLHWNLNELNNHFSNIVTQVKTNYANISQQLNVKMHSEKGVDDFKAAIDGNVGAFMAFSREKSENAQSREFVTIQPKEKLQTLSKAKITITNYLGGQYFLTVDEIKIVNQDIYLIENKYSQSAVFPSLSDIKDGLLKMILYANLEEISIGNDIKKAIPTLLLTSEKIQTKLTSAADDTEIAAFLKLHNAQNKQSLISTLFKEARQNNFLVILDKA